ncbi:MAG: hypothetical protein GF399_05545 [Candidatus Coatesbacteria bacterium]|nr:hypothetical protein [Candidatus Coatesbacteria bacterium]
MMNKLLVALLLVPSAMLMAETVMLRPGPDDCIDTFIWETFPDANYDVYDYFCSGYSEGYVLSLRDTLTLMDHHIS